MRLVLLIRAGSELPREIVIEEGTVTRVGRKSPADLVFPDDPGMSRVHFAIGCKHGTARVKDLDSSNGTWVNGQRVSDAVLKDGDEITAGGVKFTVHIERKQPRAAQPEAAPAAPPTPQPKTRFALDRDDTALAAAAKSTPAVAEISLEERLLEMLRQDFQPLYAILDGARSPQIYKMLAEGKEEARKAWEAQNPGPTTPTFQPPAAGMLEGGAQYESLFEGASKPQLTLFAPYLVSLPPWSKLLEKLVTKGWGKSWGVFLTCNLAFADLRHHLRHFLMVNMPDGNQVYFRFYDPRVLRVYLPTCTPDEIAYFFGPVWRFATENEKPESLLEFVRQERGMRSNIWHLAPDKTAAGGAAAPSPDATQRIGSPR